MRIKKLEIGGYRNLKDIKIIFSDSNVVAFIGKNGSGKSNILEATAQTFVNVKNINRIENIEYRFDVEYEIEQDRYRLENNRLTFFCYKNGRPKIQNLENYLPKYIFTYYAGETNRLNSFTKQIEDDRFQKELKSASDIDFKMITSFSLKDFSLAFLASYIFKTQSFSKMKALLGFDSVDDHRIRMKLKRPYWAAIGSSAKTFWKAKEGSFAYAFYNKLLSYDEEEYGYGAFIELENKKDTLILGAGSIELLTEIADTPLELYTQLKAFMEADVLDEILIDVKKGIETIPLSCFSEGEKQLANILLLLDLTKDKEALYLLDEFDAYLHPNWQRDFVQMLSEIKTRGQIFFTTHSPATISKLRKENVFIMRKGEVDSPNSETYNRALDEIMKEQMDIDMRDPVVEALYDDFKQAVADEDKKKAEDIMNQMTRKLDSNDPIFIKMRLILRRL